MKKCVKREREREQLKCVHECDNTDREMLSTVKNSVWPCCLLTTLSAYF